MVAPSKLRFNFTVGIAEQISSLKRDYPELANCELSIDPGRTIIPDGYVAIVVPDHKLISGTYSGAFRRSIEVMHQHRPDYDPDQSCQILFDETNMKLTSKTEGFFEEVRRTQKGLFLLLVNNNGHHVGGNPVVTQRIIESYDEIDAGPFLVANLLRHNKLLASFLEMFIDCPAARVSVPNGRPFGSIISFHRSRKRLLIETNPGYQKHPHYGPLPIRIPKLRK